MTYQIVGRPRRKRPTDRVNYKIDSGIREILQDIADREGRNEGAQVEQLVLFYAAAESLNNAGENLSFDAIRARVSQLWADAIAGDGDRAQSPSPESPADK